MGARACLAPTHLFPGNLDSSIMSSCNTRVWGRDSRLRPASSGFVNIEWKRRQQMWVHKTSKKVARLVKLHVEIQFFYAPGSFKSLLSPFFSAAAAAARFGSVGGSPQDGFQTAASGICPDAEVSWA